MFTGFLLFVASLLLVSIIFNRKPKNLPPGEWGLPIVGYAPFMEWKVSKTVEKLGKKHGKFFTMKIGSRVFVVLTDYNMIKKAFQMPEFSGRPFFYHFKVVKKNPHLGVLQSDGPVWAINRKFALKTLRDFGLGKTPILDEIILNESKSLVETLKEKVNKPIEVDWSLNVAILNVIWKLVADRRYNVFDDEIKKFAKNINDNVEDRDGPMAMLAIFPWLIPILPKFIKDKWMLESRIIKRRDEVLNLIMDIINEHKKRLDPKSPKDFIDKYLVELKEQKNNSDYSHWGDEDLVQNVYDLFIAGSETTASTLRWFFLYMAKFPEAQKIVQKEIDENVPRGQFPSLHDKDKLPFLEALTFEVNRNITLLPNSIPHEATQDVVFEGYNIPKGTIVIPDFESCHKDLKLWKYPNEFSLDNFFDEDGSVIRNKEGYLPFSFGRHSCLGESLAKMELYVFMGAILQNFEISEPIGQNTSLAPVEHINTMNYASKFNVILKLRF